MLDLLQNTLDGLLAGAGYALLALGFTLIFGVLRRMNLSYGAAIMFGCYCATWVALESPIAAPIGLVVLAVIALAGTTLGGAYVERLCFAPHARSGSGAIAAMVGSFALWMQFEEAVTLVLPRHLYSFPPLYSGAPIALGPLSLRVEALITLAVALVVCAGLWWCLYRTRFGTAARAFTQNPTAAQLSGIGPGRVMAGVFAIASIIGGTAGFLVVSTHEQVTPMLGMWATVKGLVAMMLGGLGSLPGAVIGGLVLGLVEAHAQWYLGPQLREMTVYLLLFVLLALQPAWMTRFTVAPARGD
jgi:branched-subunit amino acid ABC-type transport system permease component